ncbi:hypothetical protein EAS64_38925 [Trebonia kvetii]|uniref:Ig-like domain repeat protein n=1 Tax=Trebonia kvetii TaxID=2480626 RepID=A0A6P2BLW0_9ACTN|nr:hypothetical protein [Trebonia kvetii]TVZ00049.1 hypothetical protein EAS64_38925 [Trebonia kvetii]
MRRTAILAAFALAAAALSAVVPVSAARSDTTVLIPLISHYYKMVVDSTHDHVFISATNAGILVTDFSGQTVTVIGADGRGMTLSPDGSTLYATNGWDVDAFSTATLEQTATAEAVAVQSGTLWVSYEGNAASQAIGDFDLSAADPAFETQPSMGSWTGAPLIAADPSDTGNVLVVVANDADPTSVVSFDTSQDPPTVRVKTAKLLTGAGADCAVVQDLAVLPGGARFIPVCGDTAPPVPTPTAEWAYSTADLSVQGTYGPVPYPDSVAIASGTGLVAAGGEGRPQGPYIFTPGTATAVNLLGDDGMPGGLALSAGGSKLFSVTTGSYATPELLIYDNPAVSRSALTLTSTSVSAAYGSPVKLGGSLMFGDTAPAAGTVISVSRSGPDGTKTLTAATNGDGSFTLTDTPPATGSYSYAFSYAGNSSATTAQAGADVTVTKAAPVLTLSVSPKTATYRPVLHISVHLGTANGDRTVSVYAKPSGAARTLVARGAVNSAGNLILSYPAAHTTTFSAAFAGDAEYPAKTVTVTAWVNARVTEKVSGYYASKRIGSVVYRLYHHTARVNVAVSVAPNKQGECVKLEVQEFSKGQWRASHVTGCAKLGTKSTAGVSVALSHDALGVHYRIRGDYLHGSDITNLSAESGWQYFVVAK